MELLPILLLLGVNLTLWTLVGGLRLSHERLTGGDRAPPAAGTTTLSPADVAVLVPAHNEEPVIAATIDSVLRLVPAANVHVIADGCTDATATIARGRGVNVLELMPGRGKAGGIETAVRRFAIPERFAVLLIVDADTRIDERYLERGLPLMARRSVVALAGYAYSGWRPQELSPVGRFLVSYRARLYAVMQWLKYGQTWRWTNVTAIVPGFASMYRTDALRAMDLNPPGLVIEDFNMTFEVHRKRLGKIAFRPAAHATTQDPDNLRDYFRQVLRWHLGFWQTIRRHGLWVSGFCAALLLFLAEVLLASVGIILLVAVLVGVGAALLVSLATPNDGWLAGLSGVTDFLSPPNLLLFLVLPDYLLTCVTALALRRPSMLLYGIGFLGLRFVDAIATLLAIPLAWRAQSNGQWHSPTRRPVTTDPAAVRATPTEPPAAVEATPTEPPATVEAGLTEPPAPVTTPQAARRGSRR